MDWWSSGEVFYLFSNNGAFGNIQEGRSSRNKIEGVTSVIE